MPDCNKLTANCHLLNHWNPAIFHFMNALDITVLLTNPHFETMDALLLFSKIIILVRISKTIQKAEIKSKMEDD